MTQAVEELDISKTLNALGVDSLVTVEIRNWIKATIRGVESAMELVHVGSIEALGALAVEGLKRMFEVKSQETERS